MLQFLRRDVLQHTDFDPAAIENRRLAWTFSFEAAGSKAERCNFKGLVFDFYLNRKRNKCWLAAYSCNFNIHFKLTSVVQLIARLCRYVINTVGLEDIGCR